jgi:hypothetical protein
MTRKGWFKLGAFVLATIWAFRTVGPNSGGALSRETTYITAPLAEDGLPNYALAMLADRRKGITPENNAAVLLWQAMGPMGMSDEQFRLVCQELTIDPPSSPDYLTPVRSEDVRRSLIEFMRKRLNESRQKDEKADDPVDGPVRAGKEPGSKEDESWMQPRIDLIFEIAAARPWTAEDCPPLAQWVAENEAPLDLLVEAAERPEFFSPWPHLLENPEIAVADLLLPHAQAVRDGIRSLAVRATHRAAEKRYGPAWQDCLACWRWADHLADSPTLVERLVAMAVRSSARDSTLVLLEAEGLPAEIAEQALADLNSITPVVTTAGAFDYGERLLYLDGSLRLLTGRLGGLSALVHDHIHFKGRPVAMMRTLAYDLDEPLRRGNEWYDRLVQTAKIQDFKARRAAAKKLDAELSRATKEFRTKFRYAAMVRPWRSEYVANSCIALLAPHIQGGFAAEDRDAAQMMLIRTAAALALHRARHRTYPDALAELTPALLEEAPVDRFSDKPPIYQRRGEGYLLYSVFDNGMDDGGDDYGYSIRDGEWFADGEHLAYDKSDLVIRLPLSRPKGAIKRREK